MRIIDLTHLMHEYMPVFPGTEKPKFERACTIEKNGFAETLFTMYSHTGTHMDAPSHMEPGANSLDKLDIGHFAGKAVVLDFSERDTLEITQADLQQYQDRIKGMDFIILRTGWDQKWGGETYFDRFPFLTADAAKWLTEFNLKGVGIDAISIDDMADMTFPVHYIFFKKNMIVVENLTNLTSIGEQPFLFTCFPLRYGNADGSPIRAVAIID